MRPDEVIAELRSQLAGALIALDFDGTLAPIVDDPQQSRPAPGAIAALRALAGRGARIGVVTGRDARTVLRLGGLDAVPGVVIEGLYGLEQWQDGRLTAPDTPEPIESLRSSLPGVLAEHRADGGVWVEDKRLSLVVHTRPAADPAAEQLRLRGPAEELAAQLGLEVHAGRNVLEFRLPGFDKAGALRRLVGASRPTAVLYAGDDLGDLPAFGQIAEIRRAGTPAWAVAAASDEAPAELVGAADGCVDGPAGGVQLLAELARA
ncbi:MAG: trehalose 6-phosphate phosphatase [Pseudonocardiales bacterium]|nr:trehalose 6-phosphate phosphatase [Pseudonocardiales bacterium]